MLLARKALIKQFAGIGNAIDLAIADVNGDNSFTIADIVTLDNYLKCRVKNFPEEKVTTTTKKITTTTQTTTKTTTKTVTSITKPLSGDTAVLSGDTLTLKGKIVKEEVQSYAGNYVVKKVVAEKGAVLPADCSDMELVKEFALVIKSYYGHMIIRVTVKQNKMV